MKRREVIVGLSAFLAGCGSKASSETQTLTPAPVPEEEVDETQLVTEVSRIHQFGQYFNPRDEEELDIPVMLDVSVNEEQFDDNPSSIRVTMTNVSDEDTIHYKSEGEYALFEENDDELFLAGGLKKSDFNDCYQAEPNMHNNDEWDIINDKMSTIYSIVALGDNCISPGTYRFLTLFKFDGYGYGIGGFELKIGFK